MTRVIFVFPPAPLVANYSGAASRYVQNFTMLRGLCDEVHVVRIGTQDAFDPVLEFEANSPEARAVITSAASWEDVTCLMPKKSRNRFDILKLTALDPVDFEFPTAQVMAPLLKRIIQKIQPDFLWVEHAEPAAAVEKLDLALPWVLSNHDLMHRIRQIRKGTQSVRDRWLLMACRRAEEKIARSATLVLTGSATDGERLKAMGCSQVTTIPMAYETLPDVDLSAPAADDMRIVHLGSLETTANRVGLEAYLRKAHQEVTRTCHEQGIAVPLWIIGDASRVKDPLASLLTDAGAILKGFVADLGSVLRPFDVSILPYEHDSGYRTKLPLLFHYGQVVVSTRAAVAGTQIPGLEDVCILLDDLSAFPAALARLAANPAEREHLGRAAKAFFQQHFTPEAIKVDYMNLLTMIPVSQKVVL